MITAKELKRIQERSVPTKRWKKKLEKELTQAVKNGHDYVIHTRFMNKLQQDYLKNLGYEVERYDSEIYSYTYKITWGVDNK